jgi:hypothetical protein
MKNQNSRAYNFLKRGCGDRTADAALVTAIGGLTVDTSLKLNDLLDLIRECEIRGRAVGSASIGGATSVLS